MAKVSSSSATIGTILNTIILVSMVIDFCRCRITKENIKYKVK